MGATSHIAKTLIYNFLQAGQYQLSLFGRSADKINSFLQNLPKIREQNTDYSIFIGYDNFLTQKYDAIINCIGVGTSNKLEQKHYKWFTVTEEFDNLALSYLNKINRQALYISFSSGTIYGRDFTKPANQKTINHLPVNDLQPTDYYAIARLNAETKHRALEHLNIVDLRLFSFFSRFIDLSDNYLMTELLNCTIQKKTFHTNKQNIVRDFIHPEDLFSIIVKCLEIPTINQAFDINSLKAVDKWSLVHYFQERYSLNVNINSEHHPNSATGSKEHYYSDYKNTGRIKFKPTFTSMETIQQETMTLLSMH